VLIKKKPRIKKGVNGTTLDPYEVVFVKMKERTSSYHNNFKRVDVYEKWID
jgi:hypothetical protein